MDEALRLYGPECFEVEYKKRLRRNWILAAALKLRTEKAMNGINFASRL